MDKLSQIVKGSGSSSVSLAKERPVRTGAPAFGQPVAKPVHVYEVPEQEPEFKSAFNQKAIEPTGQEKSGQEKQTEIVDRVNFSFKKPEAVAEANEKNADREEIQELRGEEGLQVKNFSPSAGAIKSVGPELDGRNVNLSIYV